MRHHNANRKFGRVRKVRTALLKSLARSLVLKGKIMTTDAKARELRPYVEKMVTAARKETVATRRALAVKVGPDGAKKLISDIAPKYADRKGGYTRITKFQNRLSDGAAEAVIEFV